MIMEAVDTPDGAEEVAIPSKRAAEGVVTVTDPIDDVEMLDNVVRLDPGGWLRLTLPAPNMTNCEVDTDVVGELVLETSFPLVPLVLLESADPRVEVAKIVDVTKNTPPLDSPLALCPADIVGTVITIVSLGFATPSVLHAVRYWL